MGEPESSEQNPPMCQPFFLGGSGPPAVLLHGFGADRNTWIGTAPALFDSATVWAIELPGHGEAWRSAAPHALNQLCESISASVLAIADEPTHFIGHSLGGALAVMMAARHPTRVASLSLLAPLGLGQGVNSQFLRNYAAIATPDDAIECLHACVYDRNLITATIADYVLQQLTREGVKDTLTQLATMAENEKPEIRTCFEMVQKSKLPTVLFWGQQDKINPPDESDMSFFNGNWNMLQSCGHLPHIERRSELNKRLSHFLQAQC